MLTFGCTGTFIYLLTNIKMLMHRHGWIVKTSPPPSCLWSKACRPPKKLMSGCDCTVFKSCISTLHWYLTAAIKRVALFNNAAVLYVVACLKVLWACSHLKTLVSMFRHTGGGNLAVLLSGDETQQKGHGSVHSRWVTLHHRERLAWFCQRSRQKATNL